MFRFIALTSHAALFAFFAYAQYHGTSFLGSDEESPKHGSQQSTYHK